MLSLKINHKMEHATYIAQLVTTEKKEHTGTVVILIASEGTTNRSAFLCDKIIYLTKKKSCNSTRARFVYGLHSEFASKLDLTAVIYECQIIPTCPRRCRDIFANSFLRFY